MSLFRNTTLQQTRKARTLVGVHVRLHRGVAARVEDLAADNLMDGGEREGGGGG